MIYILNNVPWKHNNLPWLKKSLFIMRCMMLFLLVGTLQSFASLTYSQTTKFSLNLENSTVKTVLSTIEEKSDFYFTYSVKEINANREVSISVRDKTVMEVLNTLFNNTDIHYVINEKHIALYRSHDSKNNKNDGLFSVMQQGRKITCIVSDASGPLIGANVMIKGTTNGTITDVDGKASLENVSSKSLLVVSFVGYLTQEIAIGNQTSIQISLKEDTKALDEVVVIGYGSVRKSDLTGAVSQINSKVLENQADLRDPIQGLQGKVAGLDITIGNKPGDTSTPIIRGYNSLNASNDPLIVLDGAPFSGKISDINPAEIETIDVLKDASSTAIYGSRGSNGVIIMTTKRGKMDGKMQLIYDAYVGFSKSFHNFNMMSGDKYADYLRAANPGKTDEELFTGVTDILKNKNYVDWQNELFSGTGFQTDNNITVRVGKDKVLNTVVLGYNKNQSIINNMSSERFSIRLNGDAHLLNCLKVGYSTMYSHTKTNLGDDDVFLWGTVTSPISRINDENGKLFYYPSPYCESYMQINPLYRISKEYLKNQSFRDRAFFNFFADIDFLDGLTLHSSITPDLQFYEDGVYNSPYLNLMSYNSMSYKKTTEKSLTFTNILKYEKTFGEHNFAISVVHDMQTYQTDFIQLTGSDVPYYGKWYNVNEAPDIFNRRSYYSKWSILSFMGRINYTLKNKYLLTITGRYDASSRLAKGNKWSFFPSVALAWRINSESFLKNISAISNLKMRLSWGNTGNTAINPYATSGAFSNTTYVFGTNDVTAIGYLPTELSNNKLGWERTEEFNIGLDFGFLNNRLEGTLDLYQRNTHDLLMKRLLPISTGYSETWQNIGKTRNSGIEFSLNSLLFENKNWNWNIGFSFAYNKNQIISLYDNITQDRGNKWFVGKPLNVELLYKFNGIWQESEKEEANKYGYEPGNPRVRDVNENYKYDQDDQFIYNKIPKVTAGLNTSIKYKHLDLNIYSYSRIGYGSVVGVLTYEAGSSRTNSLNVDFWTASNPSNTFPKPIVSNSQDLLVQSNFCYRNLSFVRLKNVNIGYTFPNSIIERVKASHLRIYLAVDNPYVFTFNKFEGLDPENCLSYSSHRPLTSFLLGLNVSF